MEKTNIKEKKKGPSQNKKFEAALILYLKMQKPGSKEPGFWCKI